MMGRPELTEAAPHFHPYINLVPGDHPLAVMESQLEEAIPLFAGISEEASQRRYQPDKWSIRQVLNHVTDTERAFAFRTLWFARGFTAPLPGYDQNIAAAGAGADAVAWRDHVEEFLHVRRATIALFRNLPPEAWTRSGVASGNSVTVRALAFIIPGHWTHHVKILRERYL
jgi:hypothetical protein